MPSNSQGYWWNPIETATSVGVPYYGTNLTIRDIKMGEVYYPTTKTGELRVKTSPFGGRCYRDGRYALIRAENTKVIRILI